MPLPQMPCPVDREYGTPGTLAERTEGTEGTEGTRGRSRPGTSGLTFTV